MYNNYEKLDKKSNGFREKESSNSLEEKEQKRGIINGVNWKLMEIILR